MTVSQSSTFLRPALCLEKVHIEGTPVEPGDEFVSQTGVGGAIYLSVSSREYISSGG